MTLRELELFYRMDEEPHLSHLAHEMGISQSALSLALRSLEEKLGEPLFDRLGKKLILNDRGRTFRRETLPHYEALIEAGKAFGDARLSGELTIHASKTIGDYLLPQVRYDFLQKHPNVVIQSALHNSRAILTAVRQGQIDLGLIESPLLEPEIVRVPLATDTLVVVTSDPTLGSDPIFIDRLFDRKWLLREPGSGTRDVFLSGLGSLANELPVWMEYNDFEEAKTLLLNHPETLTCLSRHAVAREITAGQLHEVTLRNLTFTRELALIYHRQKYRSRLFDAFLEECLRYFEG